MFRIKQKCFYNRQGICVPSKIVALSHVPGIYLVKLESGPLLYINKDYLFAKEIHFYYFLEKKLLDDMAYYEKELLEIDFTSDIQSQINNTVIKDQLLPLTLKDLKRVRRKIRRLKKC